ncbi:MAG: ABC transporter ATP-binding protein [Candidatus Neomarinimicrobiota bacterium]
MIQVQDLNYTYHKGSKPAVRDLEFAVADGEIFGFLGPSGAGKSTTQKIIIGLLQGYGGTVSVLGRDLADWGNDYYERIGVSFEIPNLYLKLTARENLTYFGSLYRSAHRTPEELLEAVGLEEESHTPVAQFSKGMKNRLNVARALLHDPALLFMDEPTVGLDPVNAGRIKDLIRRQQEAGKTIFLTTHDMTVADELCDRVAFLVDGRIELIDSPRELKLRYGRHQVRVEFLEDGRTMEAGFDLEGLGGNEQFLDLLRRADLQTIHTLEASLADVFIQVTGRKLA